MTSSFPCPSIWSAPGGMISLSPDSMVSLWPVSPSKIHVVPFMTYPCASILCQCSSGGGLGGDTRVVGQNPVDAISCMTSASPLWNFFSTLICGAMNLLLHFAA